MRKIIELDGQSYTWDGSRWADSSFMIPPTGIVSRLNALIEDGLSEDDIKITDNRELISRARTARAAGQYDRAERIVRRVLTSEPSNLPALSVLCAVLRKKGLPDKAVEETEPFKNSNERALLTSRAAALCDLERWEEAKKEIGRVLAMGSSDEAFLVVNRIKRARPNLYEKDLSNTIWLGNNFISTSAIPAGTQHYERHSPRSSSPTFQVATEESWKDRIIGESDEPEVELGTDWSDSYDDLGQDYWETFSDPESWNRNSYSDDIGEEEECFSGDRQDSQVLPHKTSDVAVDLTNLAGLYYKQGDYAQAEPLLKRSLAIGEKALGPEHPDVARILHGLAMLCIAQGKHAEAEPLLKRSLAIREKTLGLEHPVVAATLESMSGLYRKTGRETEAEEVEKRAAAIRATKP